MKIVKLSKSELEGFGIGRSSDTRVYFHPVSLVGGLFWFRFEKMLELAEPKKNEVALDFGCGHGLFLPTLSTYYKKVTGVDIRDLPQTKTMLERLGCKNVEVLKMDGTDLKFKDGSFDVVFCADVLEHFKDLKRPLKEIFRVLKPGGKIIINSPLETRFFGFIRGLAGFNKPSDHYHSAEDIYEETARLFNITEKYNFPPLFGKFRMLEIVKAEKGR